MAYLGPSPARTPVTSDQITDASVTAAKLATDSVTTVKIAADNVTTAKLADANVTTAKLADANVTTAKLAASSALVGKNLIINGAMTVAQRGTSFTALTDAYCLDQFIYIKDASTAVIDVTQSTDVPSGEGFGKSLKIDVTTADASIDANDLAKIQTPIEAQNLTQLKYGSAGAQTMTLSFWIKSTKTGTFNAFAYQPDGNRFYNASYTVNVTDTWEHKTVTISGDSGGTINDDTGAGLIVGWTLIAGTNWTGSADTWSGNADYAVSSYSMLDSTSNNILITGVQLEVGSVATDFEHEDISVTEAKCERRLQRYTGSNSSGGLTDGRANATTTAVFNFPFRQKFASAPAFSRSATVSDFNIDYAATTVAMTALASGVGTEALTQATVAATVGSAVLTVGQAVALRINNNSTWIQYSCEL
jgi:hypothetical protein